MSLTNLPDRSELPAISSQFDGAEPLDILRWAVDTYGTCLTMATAFGVEGCVLMDMLSRLGSDARQVHIFNLDTGYQFKETLELREKIQARYGFQIELISAKESREQMEARFGGPIYGSQPDECCRIRKVVPLKETLEGYGAWLSAIRRDQTKTRANHDLIQWDNKYDLAKISPLGNWTREDVWAYVRNHNVDYNPLHDQGYPSIGCQPCTRPVQEGENERAGRWSGTAKTECGLHFQI